MRFSCLRIRASPLTSRFGGAEGIRTPDLLVANETRYQLRHSPMRLEREEEVTTGTGANPNRGDLGSGAGGLARGGGVLVGLGGRAGRLGGLAGQNAVGLVVARGADAGELDGPDRTTGTGLV